MVLFGVSEVGFGIILGVLGSIFINTGNNVQSVGLERLQAKRKKETNKQPGDDSVATTQMSEEPTDDACESPMWICGTIIFVTGSLLNFAAFAFAPQSILAALEGIQFVSNIFFARVILQKPISQRMYCGTATIVFGVIVTVLSASVVPTLEASTRQLMNFWTLRLWHYYLISCVFLGMTTQIIYLLYTSCSGARLCCGIIAPSLPAENHVKPWTYATFSAIFGTLSVVQAKVLSELLMLQVTNEENVFWGRLWWFTYATLFGWLLLTAVWLYRMVGVSLQLYFDTNIYSQGFSLTTTKQNEAIRFFDPLFIIPLLQVNFIVFGIVSGIIFFQEYQAFRLVNWIGFVGGIILLIVGIFLLSPVEMRNDEPDRRLLRRSSHFLTPLAARQGEYFPDTADFALLRSLESRDATI